LRVLKVASQNTWQQIFKTPESRFSKSLVAGAQILKEVSQTLKAASQRSFSKPLVADSQTSNPESSFSKKLFKTPGSRFSNLTP
jgi:hypothetical protein